MENIQLKFCMKEESWRVINYLFSQGKNDAEHFKRQCRNFQNRNKNLHLCIAAHRHWWVLWCPLSKREIWWVTLKLCWFLKFFSFSLHLGSKNTEDFRIHALCGVYCCSRVRDFASYAQGCGRCWNYNQTSHCKQIVSYLVFFEQDVLRSFKNSLPFILGGIFLKQMSLRRNKCV